MNRCVGFCAKLNICKVSQFTGNLCNLTVKARISTSGCNYLWLRDSALNAFPRHSFNATTKTSLTSPAGVEGYTLFCRPNLSLSANFSTRRKSKNGDAKAANNGSLKQSENSEDIDDLKAIWKDSSLSLTAKFKVLFKQYGVVLVVVHLMTAVFWMTIFYLIVSWGFDVVSFLENHGVFDFLERIGLPASDKLKSPGASNLLSAYLIYEIAKPIRLPVTILATIYTVRVLRRLKYLKPPPKAQATVRDLVSTRREIARHQFNKTTSKYQDRYRVGRLKLRNRLRKNGLDNGKKRTR